MCLLVHHDRGAVAGITLQPFFLCVLGFDPLARACSVSSTQRLSNTSHEWDKCLRREAHYAVCDAGTSEQRRTDLVTSDVQRENGFQARVVHVQRSCRRTPAHLLRCG